MARRLTVGGLAFGLALLLLPACSSDGPSANGPFGNGGSTGGECIPAPPGGVVTYGFEEFRNSGGTATIKKVALVSPRQLRIVAAWAVPITGTNLYGVVSGPPPMPNLAPGVQWAHRQRADGAVIPHSRGHDVTNLVLVLKPTGSTGTAKALDVYYQAGGTNYLMRMPFSIEVPTGKKCT